MKLGRRKYFQICSGLAISGLAGCTSGNQPDDSESNTEMSTSTEKETTTTMSDGQLELSDLLMKAKIDNGDEETPPTIILSLENNSDISGRLSAGATPPFSEYWPASGGDLILIPEDTEYLVPDIGIDGWVARSDSGCWKATERLKVESIGIGTNIPKNGSIEQRYRVVTRNSADSCANSGSYVYSQSITVAEEEIQAEVEIELNGGEISAAVAQLY